MASTRRSKYKDVPQYAEDREEHEQNILRFETSAEGIATTFIEFYKDLLGTSTSNTVRVNSCLVREGNILKDDHRSMLEREFKSE